jgi:hypothetical protein
MTSTAPVLAASGKVKLPRGERSYAQTLRDASGATLRFQAKINKNGTAVSSAKYSVKNAEGKKESKRYGTLEHADFASAKSKVDELAGKFAKEGYVKSGRVIGPRKPDAGGIDMIPKAKSAAKK